MQRRLVHTHSTEESTYTLAHIRSDVLIPCEGGRSAPTCKRGLSDKVRKAPEATPAHPLPRSSYIDSFLLHPSHPNTPSLPPPTPSRTLLSKSISRSLHYRSLGHRLLHLWGENVCILCLCVVSAVGERGGSGLLGRPRDLVHGQVPEAVCISKRVSPPPRCRISRLPLLPTAHSPRISPLCFRKTQKVKNTLEGCL